MNQVKTTHNIETYKLYNKDPLMTSIWDNLLTKCNKVLDELNKYNETISSAHLIIEPSRTSIADFYPKKQFVSIDTLKQMETLGLKSALVSQEGNKLRIRRFLEA